MEKLPKNNYFKMGEDILNNLDKPSRVLLHSCCAPCSSACIEYLTKYVDVTVLYYNPNIEPYEEYLKRKNEEIRFIKEYPSIHKVDIIDCDYDNDKFRKLTCGLEDLEEGGVRCHKCYLMRMLYTGYKAQELGYDYFCTTLTLSPYKNSQVLNRLGHTAEVMTGAKYLYTDFKKNNGNLRSIELSKEYNLYRQDYCGCVFSKRDRDKRKQKQERL